MSPKEGGPKKIIKKKRKKATGVYDRDSNRRTDFWDTLLTIIVPLMELFKASRNAISEEIVPVIPNASLNMSDIKLSSFLKWLADEHKKDGEDNDDGPTLVRKLARLDQAGNPANKATEQYASIVKVLRGMSFPKDSRLWDLIHLPEFTTKLSSTFMTSTLFLNMNEGRTSMNRQGFVFPVATTFERMLYILFIRHLQYLKKKSSKFAPYFQKKREVAANIAFAVQQVVRAWNTFSKDLGFNDVEAMTAPYILLHKEEFRFKALEKREEGYARKSQATSFKDNSGPTREE